VRARDRAAAEAAMNEHLEAARHAQKLETPPRESE
jgi:DNA-binding FadR family transcriptional regulator